MEIVDIPITHIRPPKLQPRMEIDPDGIQELAASIQRHGLLQPLIVAPDGDGYELLAGYRRYHALQSLAINTVPCRIIRTDPALHSEITIAENLIRQDLSSVEEAYAFALYLQETGEKHEALADRLGKERTYVTRRLLLLDLDDATLAALQNKTINLSMALELRKVPDTEMRERLIQHVETYGANARVMAYWVANYTKEQARAEATGQPTTAPADYQPPRQVMMGCDRCSAPTDYERLRATYLCPKCQRIIATHRAAEEDKE